MPSPRARTRRLGYRGAVHPLREISLVAGRELLRALRSAKGLALLVLALLGAVLLATLASAVNDMGGNGVDATMRESAYRAMFGDAAVARRLAQIPAALITVDFATTALLPLFVLLVGFDGVSAELQHRTLRFFTVRTRRPSYYLGKVLGLFAVVTATSALVHLVAWGVLVARGLLSLQATLSWGPLLWLTLLPISLAWSALAVLFSSLFRQPFLALISGFIGYVALAIAQAWLTHEKLPALVYPSSFDRWLLHPSFTNVVTGVLLSVGFAAVTSSLGVAIFARRDA